MKYFFSFWLLVSFAFSQNQIDKNFILEVDFFFDLLKKETESLAEKKEIPNLIAVFEYPIIYGLTREEEKYFNQRLGQFYRENIYFRVVDKNFRVNLKEGTGDNIQVFQRVKDASDYLRYARSVGSEHYANIFLYRFDTSYRFKIDIRDAKDNQVVWEKEWNFALGHNGPIYYFAWRTALRDLFINQKLTTAYYLSHFFGARLVGVGNLGALLETGIDYEPNSDQRKIVLGAGIGASLQLNLFELARISVGYLDLFLATSFVAFIHIPLSVSDSESENILYIPYSFFSQNIGMVFLLKESSFMIETGIDVLHLGPYFLLGLKF